MLKRILLLFFFTVMLSACGRQGAGEASRDELNPPANAYTQAAPCSQADAACQTLLDFYERKPGFKEQLLTVMDASGIAKPLWMEKALSTRLLRTTFEGAPLIMGRVCEPRNCAQILYVVYNEQTATIFGLYRTNDRSQWFGDPTDAEKLRLCEEEPACTLESKVSELPAMLTRWAYPGISQPAEFANCSEVKGGITAKDGSICQEQYIAKCPYGNQGCTVNGEFVGDQLSSVAFKYKYRQMKYEELKKSFDKAYGAADTVASQPDQDTKDGVWLTTWRDGRVSVTLRRVKGVNALGERYDDVWLIYADKAFALFN